MQPMRPMQSQMQSPPRPMPQPTPQPVPVYHEADPNLDPAPYQQQPQYQPAPAVMPAPELYNNISAAHPINRGQQQMQQAQSQPQPQPQSHQQEVSYDPKAGELTITNKLSTVPVPQQSAQELFVGQLLNM